MTKRTQEQALTAQFDRMLTAFRAGTAPAALAQELLRPKQGTGFPSDGYSFRNRLILALHGESVAAGYRAWQGFDRQVKKGESAIYILAPMMYKPRGANGKPDPEAEPEVRGFRAQAVFGLSQTEGAPVVSVEPDFLETLPLREVAEAWGVTVELEPFDGRRLGSTNCADWVRLSTKNLSTWAHELVHVADVRAHGNVAGIIPDDSHAKREAVAELGGAVLLACLGDEEAADVGGCLEYLRAQTRGRTPKEAIHLAQSVMVRTLEAVQAILDEAGSVELPLPSTASQQQLALF